MIPSAPRAILVGAGRMGTHHLNVMRRGSGLRLAGIVERDATRHPRLAQEFQAPCASSLDEALDRIPAECALVCTPDPFHAADALRCLAAGLHVLVEKPLCPSLSEAQHLVEAFRVGGRVLAGGLVERHNPAWKIFLRHLPSVGSAETLDILRSGRVPAHRSCGILRDLAIHDLDLLWGWRGALPLLGSPPRNDTVAFLRGCEDPRVSLVARWDDAPPRRQWCLRGSLGELVLDLQERHVVWCPRAGDPLALEVPPDDPLEQEHRQFADAVLGRIDSAKLEVGRQLEVLAFCEALDPAVSPPTD